MQNIINEKMNVNDVDDFLKFCESNIKNKEIKMKEL
jgi:hypothetical protein